MSPEAKELADVDDPFCHLQILPVASSENLSRVHEMKVAAVHAVVLADHSTLIASEERPAALGGIGIVGKAAHANLAWQSNRC